MRDNRPSARPRALPNAVRRYRRQVRMLLESELAPGLSIVELECMCAGFTAGYRTAVREADASCKGSRG